MKLNRAAAKQAVLSAALGINALDETQLFERLESLYWIGAKASLDALTLPGLHPATQQLVQRFAAALAAKLHDAETKHGFSDGWRSKGWMRECREALRLHVFKGDPIDVAAYCAFLWHHGERTSLRPAPRPAPKTAPAPEPTCGADLE